MNTFYNLSKHVFKKPHKISRLWRICKVFVPFFSISFVNTAATVFELLTLIPLNFCSIVLIVYWQYKGISYLIKCYRKKNVPNVVYFNEPKSPVKFTKWQLINVPLPLFFFLEIFLHRHFSMLFCWHTLLHVVLIDNRQFSHVVLFEDNMVLIWKVFELILMVWTNCTIL